MGDTAAESHRKRPRSRSQSPQQRKRHGGNARTEATPSSSHSRPRSRSRSPPRQRKRPGGAARIDASAKARLEERQRQRENEQQLAVAQTVAARGSGDVVRQHYNAVPQRGREWRQTSSRISNVRSYNNWVKSCLIQKFSPAEEFRKRDFRHNIDNLKVLDIGCGKGGDLGKWQKAPQRVELYIGIDPAEVSVEQARERYSETARRARGRLFEGHFIAKDGYGEWIGDIPIVRDVGVDPAVSLSGAGSSRWGGGGFDVVTMMFCMHYSFETEAKARGMLRNVAGALKRGGRFIGAIPDSDVIRQHVEDWYAKQDSAGSNDGSKKTKENSHAADAETNGATTKDTSQPPQTPPHASTANKETSQSPQSASKSPKQQEPAEAVVEWGNDLYTVRFPPGPGAPPRSGVFRPPFGWRYQFFLEEAVESVPEYAVPFEAFRAMAEDYNLELQYRRPFLDVWREERDHEELGPLAERMRVPKRRDGELDLNKAESEVAGFYLAFCFYKV